MVKQDYFKDLFLHGTNKKNSNLLLPLKIFLPNKTTVAVTKKILTK